MPAQSSICYHLWHLALSFIFNFYITNIKLIFLQCVPILGRGFDAGGYKCDCKQGYEFPLEQKITYFDGQLVEGEFENLVQNKETRFDMYKCRIAGASTVQLSSLVIVITLTFSILHKLLVHIPYT